MEPTALQSHTRASIHPYVEQDLRDSELVGIYPWVEAAFGVPRHCIDKWASKIGELRWFEDEIVQKALDGFCEAKIETKRYKPFCELANRIVFLARGNLPHIPKSNSYPVDSITFVPTATRPLATIPEHGELGARRYLDVTVTHGEASRNVLAKKQMEWVDVLHAIELKRTNLRLAEVLAHQREKRAAAASKPRPAKATATKSKTADRSGRRRGKVTSKQPTASQTVAVAGTKRKREDIDILAGLELRFRKEEEYYEDEAEAEDARESRSRKLRLQKGKEAAHQAGAYALEVMSCTYGTRVCCHSTILEDDLLVFMYFDACGILYTTQYLSLIEDFEKAAAIILALARCTPERFGALPTSIIKPPTPYRKRFPPQNLTGNVVRVKHPLSGKQIRVTLKDSLYSQYVLTGRRTFTYTMKASPEISKEELMVKFSYQTSTRREEHELLNIAREAGVPHLPDVHMWADLWKMSDGARQAFYGGDEKHAQYEDRTLRMIVYTEYGTIKTLFSQRCDLIPVMVYQMVNCLHDLRHKANMLHRDISVDNIMFQIRRGKYYFILNDFDMAIVLQRDDGSPYTPSAKHRTGTLPFMAVSLVHDAYHYKESPNWKPTKHLLRHDYESLFWVCLWCILALQMHTVSSEKQESYRKTLMKWECSDLDTVQASKLSLSVRHFSASGITLPPAALCLEKWLDGWNAVLWDLVVELRKWEAPAKPPASYDLETANGIVSKENLLKTLTPLMPFTQSEDDDQDEDPEPPVREVPVVALKRPSRVKRTTADATATKAAIMSRLRPRKAT